VSPPTHHALGHKVIGRCPARGGLRRPDRHHGRWWLRRSVCIRPDLAAILAMTAGIKNPRTASSNPAPTTPGHNHPSVLRRHPGGGQKLGCRSAAAHISAMFWLLSVDGPVRQSFEEAKAAGHRQIRQLQPRHGLSGGGIWPPAPPSKRAFTSLAQRLSTRRHPSPAFRACFAAIA